KTTHVLSLFKTIKNKYPVIMTREPGGYDLVKTIKQILITRGRFRRNGPISAEFRTRGRFRRNGRINPAEFHTHGPFRRNGRINPAIFLPNFTLEDVSAETAEFPPNFAL
ncbi:MAG: hypothetical protein Q8881_02680, partial [Sweet potato little leaf phytoplasma]|nr:hypothetical protein [Sweet potato little leaf phytoplasma]